jgi:hypothetical protein
VVGQRHLPWHRHLPAADQAGIRDGMVRRAHGRVVTRAVRAPVRPATRWRRVVSMASARVSAGKMVVNRGASLDFPTPGGPRRRTLESECLH